MGIPRRFFNLLFGAAKAPVSPRPQSRELEDWVFAGNYRVLNRMGSGGSACVLRATDLALKREVALKVLLETQETNAELADRFLAEGRTLASLQHPNVVTVYTLGVDERLKFPFLVMEMVKGATLANRLEEFRANPLLLFREMITVFEAIHFCHQKQIIHLDLKPSNIMVDQKGGIKIIDFGISLTTSRNDSSPFVMGTAYYMAPEQFVGTDLLSPKTDIYALGIMLWELLTGKPPFLEKGKGDPFDQLEKQHCGSPLPVEQLAILPHAAPLIPLLSRMLAKTPADRPDIPHIVQFLKEELIAQGGRIGERFDVLSVLPSQPSVRFLKARDRSLQRLVGIEMPTSEFGRRPETIQVFLDRAESLGKAQQGIPIYPRLISVDRETSAGIPFVVREFIDGVPLSESLSGFRVAPLRLMKVFIQLVQEVARGHLVRVSHGNIRLENILLDLRDQPHLVGFNYFTTHEDAVNADLQAMREIVPRLFSPLADSWTSEKDAPPSLMRLRELLERVEGGKREAIFDLAWLAADLEEVRRQFEIDVQQFPLQPKTVLGTLIHEKLARITEIDLADDHTGIAILENALREDEDPVIIAAVLPVIARLERRSELPLVFPYLTHPDPGVRLAALEAVNIVGEVGVCLQVFDLLEDPVSRVRARAASILKNLGDDRLREQLQTFAMFGLPQQQVKAVRALRYYPCEEHLMLLDLLQQNGVPEVVAAAQEVRLAFLTDGLDDISSSPPMEPLMRARIDDLHDHAVVCGYGRKGQLLAAGLFETDRDCIIIERDVRTSGLELAKARGIPTITGSASHAVTLYSAGITRARYVLAVTDDDETNLEIALKAKMFLGNTPRPPSSRPLQCLTHVCSPALKRLTAPSRRRRHHRPSRFEGLAASPGFEFRLFNVFENGARRILLDHLPSVQAFREQSQGKPLHLLVVGLSALGDNLVVQAAQLYQGPIPDMLHITVIDSAKNFEASAFRFHHPRIDRVVSLNLVPLEPKVATAATFARLSAQEPFAAVYLALADAGLNRQCAAVIRRLPGLDARVPVILVGSRRAGSESDSQIPDGCLPFDLFDVTCRIDAILGEPRDELARAIHARFLDSAPRNGSAAIDPRVTHWDRLHGDFKEWFRALADHLEIKLRAIGCGYETTSPGEPTSDFSDGEIEILAGMERQRRAAITLLDGFEHEPFEIASDGEAEECANHVLSIPGLLQIIGMRIRRLKP